jgi:methylglutaconyl-CoA hydratase
LEDGKIFFSGFAKVINACRKSSKIIIGRVQGKAVGGGVGLAAATDYCFATQAASVKLSELHIGIIPAVIEPAVSRKIGLSSFSKMS